MCPVHVEREAEAKEVVEAATGVMAVVVVEEVAEEVALERGA